MNSEPIDKPNDVRSAVLAGVQQALLAKRAEALARRSLLLGVVRFYALVARELAPLDGFHGIKVRSPAVWPVAEEPDPHATVECNIHVYVAEYKDVCPFQCVIKAAHGLTDADGVRVFEVKVVSSTTTLFSAAIPMLKMADEAELLKLARELALVLGGVIAPYLLDKFRLVNGKLEPVS